MQIAVEPIQPGYEARLRINYPNEYADPADLENAALVAQFRATVDADAVLFEARSDAGAITIARGAEMTTVTLVIPAESTAEMAPDTDVVFDLVRMEGPEPDVIPGIWHWPVRKAVTRNVE